MFNPIQAITAVVGSTFLTGTLTALYQNRHLLTDQHVQDAAYLLAIETLRASGTLDGLIGSAICVSGALVAGASLFVMMLESGSSSTVEAQSTALKRNGLFAAAATTLAASSAAVLYGAYRVGQGSGERTAATLSLLLAPGR